MIQSTSNNSGLMLSTLLCGFIVLAIGFLEGNDAPEIIIMQTPLSISQDLQEPTTRKQRVVARIDIDHLLKSVEYVESHGNPNAISKKGAKGLYQIMQKTAHKPSMGVKPLIHWSLREQKRFAKDYLQALLNRYHGQVKTALAAYNCGIGCVEYGTVDLPTETVEYVKKVELHYALNFR